MLIILQIQLTSADLRPCETESGLRRRKIRRRAQARRRSLTESRPPPNDEELRWKSRHHRHQRTTYSDDSDLSSDPCKSDRDTRDSRDAAPYGRRFMPNLTHYASDGFDELNSGLTELDELNARPNKLDELNRLEKSGPVVELLKVSYNSMHLF